ncbi:MAG: hypothetical protein WGN25_11300 [Candidatus Electrothrix sp. GW3-4]|uniref:hypothetical protein n=1 Tax=Candidatus Electrothrix sp. GW3-4 TaxID=3126740 RepID=UPI0030CDACE3
MRTDIPGNTSEASGAVIAIGDGIAAVRAEAGVSAFFKTTKAGKIDSLPPVATWMVKQLSHSVD